MVAMKPADVIKACIWEVFANNLIALDEALEKLSKKERTSTN
jgi:hypothetical protein